MAALVTHRLRGATRQLDVTRGYGLAAALLVMGAIGLVAARSIVGMNGHVPKPLVAILVLAGASILLTIDTRRLFLGWLFLAPLFQESASNSRLGHYFALALYTAPPLAFGFKALAARGQRPRREWFDWVPALYAGLLLVSLFVTASSELHSGAVGTLRSFYQNVLIGILVYYVVAFWRGRPLPIVQMVRLVMVAAALQAVMAIIEAGTGWNLWHDHSWARPGDVRSIATLANPAVTGAFIGVGIVVALSILSWQGPGSLRRLAVVMLIVGIPALYTTKTRGPLLATAVAAVLCVLLSRRSRPVGVGMGALVALSLILFWPQIRASSVYQSRIDEKQNVDARLVLQEVSIKLAERRPIFGWGYDSFDRVKFDVPFYSPNIPVQQALESTSHDTFLTILVEFGAVGLALFVLPWLAVIRRAIARARAPSPHRWFLVAGVGAILVIGVDGVTLDFRVFSFIPMVAWLFLGLIRRQLDTPTAA